jgi:TonB-dependent Receptor Plug Domain/CarboxypepD_reg-like domain
MHTAPPLLAQTASVSGTVSEAKSGETVIGVTVVVSRDSVPTSASILRGARTNKFGFYSISNVPEGAYYLVVRGLGYRTYSKRFAVSGSDASVRVNVPLTSQDVKSGEVTIQAERDPSPTKSISAVEISAETIKKIPAILGETDVFRALQLLPGIKSGNELSSGLYVRGGSPDQNLILLDGVTVYNPSHLFGFFSTFNADAIQDVRAIKGGFPAEYGGRLSSVIDMTMREGTKEKFSGTANLSLIAARLLLEGPIIEDMTFMISGRRTYFDLPILVANAINPPVAGSPTFNYYFYDLNAKINYKIGENDRVFVSGYFGRDLLDLGIPDLLKFGIDWGNATGNLRWSHIVSPTMFTNFSAIYTDYTYRQNINLGATGSDVGFNTFSQIRDATVRGEAQYFPVEEHTLKTGIEATYHRFNTSLAFSGSQEFQRFLSNQGTGNTIEAVEASAYLQDDWKVAPELTASLGFRMAYFNRGNRWLPEPRASFSYQATDEVSFKGAFAIANQFLHLVTLNGLSLPNDNWFPSTERINPANGTQYVLGAEAQVFEKEYLVSVEGYYKSLRNLYDFREDANLTSLGGTTEAQLTTGNGEAYGVEFFLNKRIGRLTGWIGYTLSWTTRTFPELNQGRTFFPRYDRRHDVSIVAQYKLNDNWDLGATWTFATGQPFTLPAAQFDFGGAASTPTGVARTPRVIYTDRNGFRLPDYHRLDLSGTYNWRGPFELPWNLTISVYNAYNRLNPFTWFISNGTTPLAASTSVTPQIQQIAIFGILPNVSIGFKF